MTRPTATLPHSVLSDLRDLLSVEWEHFKRDMPDDDFLSQDMCLLSTTYLYWLFKHAGVKGWEPAEGVGVDDQGNTDPGGMKGVDGRWYSHNWLVHSSGMILDLTADQFGHDEIVLVEKGDPRYYANRSAEYAMSRLSECTLGKEWLEFQLDDAESMYALGPVLKALSPASEPEMAISL